MIIGCDIGGVIKNLINDEPIENAIESLFQLRDAGHTIIFISKCGASYAEHTMEWLKIHKLDEFKIVFCEDYAGKVGLAKQLNVTMMIDDKMTVLKHFPVEIFTRVWFCTESKNIAGAKKFDPEFYNSVSLIQNWCEVIELIESM